MSKTDAYNTPLFPDQFYHLISQGNNKQNIFYKEKNYAYFLLKYATYMTDYLDTCAYCLLPNHFHILVRIKSLKSILEVAVTDFPLISEATWKMWDIQISQFEFPAKQKIPLVTILQKANGIEERNKIASWTVSEKIRRWLMGYAKAINKQEDLAGSLFRKKFKRKHVTESAYLKYLVWYLHNNPVHHDIFHSLQNYPHSSYQTLISQHDTRLKKGEVLEWFGGLEGFIQYHKDQTLGYDGNDIKFWEE